MSNVKYTIEKKWEDAVNKTSAGIVPLSLILLHVETKPIDVEFALGENHYPYVLASMTTLFENDELSGKLGWHSIGGELRQKLSKLLYENGLVDEWVFVSQTFDE